MKKLLLAGVSFAALIAGPAMAADLAAPVIVAAPVYSWTGGYIGINAGGTWGGNNDVTITTIPVSSYSGPPIKGVPAIGGAPAIADQTAAVASANGTVSVGNNRGFIGGGQAGYNWQFNAFVAGVEADIQAVAGHSGASNAIGIAVVPPPSARAGSTDVTTFTASKKLDYLGTVRARFGFVASPALLAYVTGGLAYGSVSGSAGFMTVNLAYTAISQTWATSPSFNPFSTTRAGWTVGGGLEWMFAPNWSVKGEYLYYDLGTVSPWIDRSSAVIQPTPGIAATKVGVPQFTNASTASIRYNGNILRVGINYKFGYTPVFYK